MSGFILLVGGILVLLGVVVSFLSQCIDFFLHIADHPGLFVHLLLTLGSLVGVAVTLSGDCINVGLSVGGQSGLLVSGLEQGCFFMFKRINLFLLGLVLQKH